MDTMSSIACPSVDGGTDMGEWISNKWFPLLSVAMFGRLLWDIRALR